MLLVLASHPQQVEGREFRAVWPGCKPRRLSNHRVWLASSLKTCVRGRGTCKAQPHVISWRASRMAGGTGEAAVARLARPHAPKSQMPKTLYRFSVCCGRQRSGLTRIFHRLIRRFKIILIIYTSLSQSEISHIKKKKQPKIILQHPGMSLIPPQV